MPKPRRTPLAEPVIEAALEMWSQAEGQHFIPITGGSMLPSIQDGDRLLVAHGWSGVQRGDVIVFRRRGRLIAHRVLRIHHHPSKPVFFTKGDSVRRFDPPVYADEIIGRVLAVERRGRQMPLDTARWRLGGWLFAVGTLSWSHFHRWGRRLKRRWGGPRPNRLTAFPGQRAQALASLAFKTFLAALCRWEE